MDVDLSIGESVRVMGKSLGFLKIYWYLYGYITINKSVEHEQAGINASDFKGSPTKAIKLLRHCHMWSSCF